MSEVEKYNKEYSAKDAMTDPMDGRKKKKKKKLPFAKRLQNMVFDEVSLVGRPANELATVVLHKSGESEFAGVEEVDTISLNNQDNIEEGENIIMSENCQAKNSGPITGSMISAMISVQPFNNVLAKAGRHLTLRLPSAKYLSSPSTTTLNVALAKPTFCNSMTTSNQLSSMNGWLASTVVILQPPSCVSIAFPLFI